MRQIYTQDILVDSNAIDFDGKFKLPSVMKHFHKDSFAGIALSCLE